MEGFPCKLRLLDCGSNVGGPPNPAILIMRYAKDCIRVLLYILIIRLLRGGGPPRL